MLLMMVLMLLADYHDMVFDHVSVADTGMGT